MGWIAPAIQSVQKRVAPRLEIICCFDPCGRHPYLLCNKNVPSDAESREEQDGSKHKVVGGTIAKLWPHLHQGVMKNTEMKDLNPAEEGDFPCKLR